MRRRWVGVWCVVPFGVFAACAGDDDPAAPDLTIDGGGGSSEASTSPPGFDSGAPGDAGSGAEGGADAASDDAGADASSCTPPATPPKVVYLNRGGGTYTTGFDDSRTNKSSLLSSTTVMTAWSVPDVSWRSLVACVKTKFAPFNVTVTDTDPGDQEHIEVVFVQGTLPDLSGQPGIAPFDCKVIPNAIALVSQTYAAADLTNGCAVAVQNVAYTLGLEPVTACPDAMKFGPTTCAEGPFTDVALTCGFSTPDTCRCGGTTQNSYQRLLAVTGPRCL